MQFEHLRQPTLFVGLAAATCLLSGLQARPAAGSTAAATLAPCVAPYVAHFAQGDAPAPVCPQVTTDPMACQGQGPGGPEAFLQIQTFIRYFAPYDECLSIHPSLEPDGSGQTAYPVNVSPFVVVTPGDGSFLVDFNISPPASVSNHRMEALMTVPDTAFDLDPLTGDFVLHVHQDAVPLVWFKGPDKGETFGYISVGDIVYTAPAPPPQATTMGVSSIVLSKLSEGGGQKRGRAVVTVLDDLGGAVSGATVTGTFTGDVGGTVMATTGASGTATLDSTTTNNGNIHFTFCVDDVTHASLAYDPGSNVETCDSL